MFGLVSKKRLDESIRIIRKYEKIESDLKNDIERWRQYVSSAYIRETTYVEWTKKSGEIVKRVCVDDGGPFIELDGKKYKKATVANRIGEYTTERTVAFKADRPGFEPGIMSGIAVSCLKEAYNFEPIDHILQRTAPVFARIKSK